MIYPWQSKQWQHLLQRRKQGNLAHAFLLHGSAGLGKLDFACAFAQLLLCARHDLTQACGECPSCQLLAAKTHPDFILVQPEAEGKVIKIDQIRALCEDFSKTALQGGYKVVVIEPADAMNIAAANALLKTLEEPEAETLLLLVSSRPQSLPATIRSRCQKIAFTIPEKEIAQHWLLKQLDFKLAADVDNLLALADGAPVRALILAESADLELRAKLLTDLQQLHRGGSDAVSMAANYLDMDLKTGCAYLINWLMRMIKLSFNANNVLDTTAQDRSEVENSLQQMAQAMDLTRMFVYLDKLLSLNKVLIDGISLNKQLLLEDLFLDFQEL